jgi:hypothetical protein
MKYEVSFPILRGFSVWEVDANSPDEAIQDVLNGNGESIEYDKVEVDFDANLAEVEEIDD